MSAQDMSAQGMPAPPVVIVVAATRAGVIGRDNGLPWRLKSDLKRFKAMTWGKPLIMGRKTFLSIGRPLPGRETIVLTRDPAFAAQGVHIVHDFAAALDLAADRARAMGAAEIIVAGGAKVYAQALARADRIELTEVAADVTGDALFPQLDPAIWRETARVSHPAGPDDEHAMSFVTLDRR